MRTLVWFLVVDGATNIVTQTMIFRSFREWLASKSFWLGKMIHCPACFGFWLGCLLGLLGLRPGGLPSTSKGWLPEQIMADAWLPDWAQGDVWAWPLWLLVLASGAAASGVAWSSHVVRAKLNETLGL